LSVVSVVCCQVEVSATSWSLVQRSPTDCGMSECDLETSRMRRPWPTVGRSATGKKKIICLLQSSPECGPLWLPYFRLFIKHFYCFYYE